MHGVKYLYFGDTAFTPSLCVSSPEYVASLHSCHLPGELLLLLSEILVSSCFLVYFCPDVRLKIKRTLFTSIKVVGGYHFTCSVMLLMEPYDHAPSLTKTLSQPSIRQINNSITVISKYKH